MKIKSQKEKIDFLVIGGQKCATTSLFKYLSSHPEIYMPPEKETNFFISESSFQNGKSWYLDEYFRSADPGQLWGEASPDYMAYDDVPRRIAKMFPKISLICSLRNPIERAYSHYRMEAMRGTEKDDFKTAAVKLVEKGATSDTKSEWDPKHEYLALGEYGRVLSNYLEYFSGEQLKVVFTESLSLDGRENVKSIYEFLGVSYQESEVLDKR